MNFLAIKHKNRINNTQMTTVEKVNMSTELINEVSVMRKQLSNKVYNLEEGINFSKLFRHELYTAITKMKNAGQSSKNNEEEIQTENIDYKDEENSISIFFVCLLGLLLI